MATILIQESSVSAGAEPELLREARLHANVKFVRGWFRAAPASLRETCW